MTGKAYHGRCASKRSWFYGVKVQVITTSDGLPIEFYIHAGAEADSTGLRAMAPDLPESSLRYPDAGYTDYGGKTCLRRPRAASSKRRGRKTASGLLIPPKAI
ncbi:MAG: hypothetical protein EOO62_21910 [Hymenobacter sp.]|nr:MAG: hypothetical protein EOO62_21910 [Hymenobacter sp.]